MGEGAVITRKSKASAVLAEGPGPAPSLLKGQAAKIAYLIQASCTLGTIVLRSKGLKCCLRAS